MVVGRDKTPEMNGRSGGTVARSAVFTITFAAFIGTVVLEAASPATRHLKYGLALLAFLMAAMGLAAARNRALDDYFRGWRIASAAALILSLLGAMWHEHVGSRFLSEAVFILVPLATAALVMPYADRSRAPIYMRLAFMGVVAAYIIETRLAVIGALADPATLKWKLLTSDVGAESNTSFLFGLFAIFFSFSRQKSWSAAAAILTILSFKRIAIIALAAVYVGQLLLKVTGIDVAKHRRLTVVLMLLVNVALLVVSYLLTFGYFDDLVVDSTGVSADWATLGRTGVWRLVFETYPVEPLGHGLGQITGLLESGSAPILNAHSDIIKYAVEAGPIACAIWVVYLYWQHSQSNRLFLLAGYVNILWITDNVSIYVPVMLLFYMTAAFMLTQDRAEQSSADGAATTPAGRSAGTQV